MNIELKKYLVTGTFEYEVEAINELGAQEVAQEMYMDMPETDYKVIEIK